MRSRRPNPPVLACTRGSSLTEYVVIVGVVAVAAIVAFAHFEKNLKKALVGEAGIAYQTYEPAPDPPIDPCANGSCGRPEGCFAAGTLIETDHGAVPIEQITVGTRVRARGESEEAGAPPALDEVAAVFVHPASSIVRLAVEGARARDEIWATPNHPFYVRGRGWTRADALVPGEDVLLDEDGGAITLRGAESRPFDGVVYNFEVAHLHTYFVGGARAWVHNPGCDGDCPTLNQLTSDYSVFQSVFGTVMNGDYSPDTVSELLNRLAAAGFTQADLGNIMSSIEVWKAQPGRPFKHTFKGPPRETVTFPAGFADALKHAQAALPRERPEAGAYAGAQPSSGYCGARQKFKNDVLYPGEDPKSFLPPADEKVTCGGQNGGPSAGYDSGYIFDKGIPRQGFPANATKAYCEAAKAKHPRNACEQGIVDRSHGCADVSQISLSALGVSRNHRLADSSIRAILTAAFAACTGADRATTCPNAQSALAALCNAMNAPNACSQFAQAVSTCLGGATPSPFGALRDAEAALSFSPDNIRFGDANVNEQIGNAFDSSGTANDAAIAGAVASLAAAGLISQDLANAATGQATYKPGTSIAGGQPGAPLSSDTRPDGSGCGVFDHDGDVQMGD